MTYKTKGIIIRRRNFGEADRLLTIYTEKRGKISAIAKAARRLLSKLGGHLELFYLVDLVVAKGKNIDIITGAIVLKDFPNLRKNLNATNQAYYIAEVIDKLIREDEKHQEVFELLVETLSKINSEKDTLLIHYFELQLLSLLGHGPELYKCVVCGKKLSEGENFFSNRLGGIIDKDCLNKDQPTNHVGFGVSSQDGTQEPLSISTEEIKILRFLLERDISITEKLVVEKQDNLAKVIRNFVESITEKEIKSKKFL